MSKQNKEQLTGKLKYRELRQLLERGGDSDCSFTADVVDCVTVDLLVFDFVNW